ncbi:GH3 domain-containing protein-like isoform X2 [Penaeus japonicus]|uniref:GH3 domain-containing protein-like isoform X2 n=1 Tax=Penaeus japonicus TaxID=27405 RepID=UPI001C70CA84|nr:GH3 domain-containing protein-like isoform X2 [Penaeus japonicus]
MAALSLFKRITKGVAVGADMSRLRWSESHTIGSASKHYLTLRLMKLLGSSMSNKIDKESEDFMKVQEDFLMNVLKENRETEYGKDMSFVEMNSINSFCKLHPLTRYNHFEAYIEKIKKGEANVLTAKTPQILGVTSGTSGQSRLLPTTKDIGATFFLNGIAVIFDRMFSWKKEMFQLQRGFKIFFTPKPRESEGGIPVGPNSTNPKNSQGVLHMYSTPLPAYDIMTEPEALYIQLLFALSDRNLGMVEANFASLVYNAFKALEVQWPALVEDIEKGRVNPDLDIPSGIREKLNGILSTNPKRAEDLKREFTEGFMGIAQRIWPHLNLVLCTTTGSQQIYADHLRKLYCAGSDIYSPLYAATEGLLGVNMHPGKEDAIYNLVPRAMFYEFIPIDESSKDQPATLLSDQVKEGETYELVITNNSGLYRYRLGDVVKINSFYRKAPTVEFMYRQGQLLNVRGEKLSEEAFYQSLQRIAGSQLADYCCAESAAINTSKETVPHYVVFVEYQDGQVMSQDKALELDADLRKEHFVYNSFRTKGSIAVPQMYSVKPGTFLALRQHLLQHTDASANQLKIPRVLVKESAIKFLMENVV